MNTFFIRARNIRNELLIKTDRYMLQDYPNLTPEQLTSIKSYRQELRDFINANKEKLLKGENVTFPPQPDFIFINIIY